MRVSQLRVLMIENTLNASPSLLNPTDCLYDIFFRQMSEYLNHLYSASTQLLNPSFIFIINMIIGVFALPVVLAIQEVMAVGLNDKFTTHGKKFWVCHSRVAFGMGVDQ